MWRPFFHDFFNHLEPELYLQKGCWPRISSQLLLITHFKKIINASRHGVKTHVRNVTLKENFSAPILAPLKNASKHWNRSASKDVILLENFWATTFHNQSKKHIQTLNQKRIYKRDPILLITNFKSRIQKSNQHRIQKIILKDNFFGRRLLMTIF